MRGERLKALPLFSGLPPPALSLSLLTPAEPLCVWLSTLPPSLTSVGAYSAPRVFILVLSTVTCLSLSTGHCCPSSTLGPQTVVTMEAPHGESCRLQPPRRDADFVKSILFILSILAVHTVMSILQIKRRRL